MPPSLSELKVLPSFCFAFKIPDNVAASTIDVLDYDNDLCIKFRSVTTVFTTKFNVYTVLVYYEI